MKNRYWLGIIFGIALILRLYQLGTLPFNFHEDEILTGYVGRFLWLNGRDLYNNPWPLLYFNKFGDYYIILPMYIKGLFTFVFGVNEFAVRFPTALFGALAIIPVYKLSEWIFRNKTVALLSAFLLAITPWHIVMSRADAEGVIGSTILLFGIVALLEWIDTKKIRSLIIAILLLLLTYFIYHPFRVIVPLVLLPLPYLLIQIKSKKNSFITLIILIFFFFSLTAYISTTVWGSGRFQQTSIFSPLSGVSIKIQELIYDEGTNNILVAKIFHNKIVAYGREFIEQFFSYFSFNYLFLEGGRSLAYKVPEQGLFYISFLGLAILSFFYLSRMIVFDNEKDKSNIRLVYLVYLTLISVLPSALTVLDAPNVHRSVLLSLFLVIFFAYGLNAAANIEYKKIRLNYLFFCIFFIEFIYFWHQYTHADFFNAIYRNDAQKQLVLYVKENISTKTPVIMPVQNTMPLFYLFYTKDFDKSYATRFKLDARINKIHNVTFFDYDCPSKQLIQSNIPKNTIIVDSHNCETDLGYYDIVNKVQGKNPLLSYKVLRFKKEIKTKTINK